MPHEAIGRELDECLASGEFVAYHKWGDDPSIFLVGVVQDLTPTKATFQSVDSRGTLEAKTDAVPLRLIHTLDRGTPYLHRLRTLYEIGPAEPVETHEARKAAEIRRLLEEAARKENVVRIWTSAEESSDVLVLAIDDETVAVTTVFDAKRIEGHSVIRLKRIVRARYGASEGDDTRVYREGERAR